MTNKAVQSGSTNTTTGNVFLPKTPESFIYDADGNLLSDGRWTNSWDAENRLITMQGLSTLPTAARLKLDFEYDWQSRRIRKTVSNWNGTQFVAASTNRFVYDAWNLVIDANLSNVPQRRYMWGLDLSGSEQGAGGVGGLLAIQDVAGGTGVHFAAYDGNGNVAALIKASDGTVSATYEYGPFGEVIRASGAMAKVNPLRFSSKYQDDETDLLYYGVRSYCPISGRWMNRDPLAEGGGTNLYAFVSNDPADSFDAVGECPCGPNVSAAVASTIQDITIKFNGLKTKRKKHSACANILASISSASNWDVSWMWGIPYQESTSPNCRDTVTSAENASSDTLYGTLCMATQPNYAQPSLAATSEIPSLHWAEGLRCARYSRAIAINKLSIRWRLPAIFTKALPFQIKNRAARKTAANPSLYPTFIIGPGLVCNEGLGRR